MEKIFKDDLYLICLECQNEFVFTGFQQKKAKSENGVADIAAYCLVCQLQHARLKAKERENKTLTGRIKWFNHTKGFGFIKSDDGSEIFFHHSQIEGKRHKRVKRGQYVQFLVVKNEKGLEATALTILPKKGTTPDSSNNGKSEPLKG